MAILSEQRTRRLMSYALAAEEDRSSPRIEARIPATLRISGNRPQGTTVHDLSLSGFGADAPSRLHPGSLCWLTLPGLAPLPATVVWWDRSRCGCAFERLLSPIVFDNLLMRYSASSPYEPRGEGLLWDKPLR